MKLTSRAARAARPQVAPVDESQPTGGTKLEWDPQDHGGLSLERAWRLAATNGLEGIAAAIGAPRSDPVNESDFLPGRASYYEPGRSFTAAQRQAAFMESGCRPTVPHPKPSDVWPWPLARGEPPFGSEPPGRIRVERSIFTSQTSAAQAYSSRAAAGRLPHGAADRAALYQTIKDDMEPWKSELPMREAGATGRPAPPKPVGLGGSMARSEIEMEGSWVTPGAGPMEATPRVPSPVF